MIDNKNLLKLLRTELQKMNNGDKTKFLTYNKDHITSYSRVDEKNSQEVTNYIWVSKNGRL